MLVLVVLGLAVVVVVVIGCLDGSFSDEVGLGVTGAVNNVVGKIVDEVMIKTVAGPVMVDEMVTFLFESSS